MTRWTRRLLVAALAPSLLGCQSLRSWQQGCPGIYSGVRYYRDQLPALPWDGTLLFSVDLPLSALVDTLALPVTAFAEPERPRSGFPIGCRWAGRSQPGR